jgi:hypothetical protein
VTTIEVIANVLRFVGLLLTLVGLWLVAGGLRVVVSGRIDERKRSAGSLKRGLPMLIVGMALLFGVSWLMHVWQ